MQYKIMMRKSTYDRARTLEQDTQTVQKGKGSLKTGWDIYFCPTGYGFNLSSLAQLIDSPLERELKTKLRKWGRCKDGSSLEPRGCVENAQFVNLVNDARLHRRTSKAYR